MSESISDYLRHLNAAKDLRQKLVGLINDFQVSLVRLAMDDYLINQALDNNGDTVFGSQESMVHTYLLPSGQYLVEIGSSGLDRAFEEASNLDRHQPVIMHTRYHVQVADAGDVNWVVTEVVPDDVKDPKGLLVESVFYYGDSWLMAEQALKGTPMNSRGITVLETVPWSLVNNRLTPTNLPAFNSHNQMHVMALCRFLACFYSTKNEWSGEQAVQFRREVINFTQRVYQALATTIVDPKRDDHEASILRIPPHSHIETFMNPTQSNEETPIPQPTMETQSTTTPVESNAGKIFGDAELKPLEQTTLVTDEAVVEAPTAQEADHVLERVGLPRDLVESAAHSAVEVPGQSEPSYLDPVRHVKADPEVHRPKTAEQIREERQDARIAELEERTTWLERALIRQMGLDPDEIKIARPTKG